MRRLLAPHLLPPHCIPRQLSPIVLYKHQHSRAPWRALPACVLRAWVLTRLRLHLLLPAAVRKNGRHAARAGGARPRAAGHVLRAAGPPHGRQVARRPQRRARLRQAHRLGATITLHRTARPARPQAAHAHAHALPVPPLPLPLTPLRARPCEASAMGSLTSLTSPLLNMYQYCMVLGAGPGCHGT